MCKYKLLSTLFFFFDPTFLGIQVQYLISGNIVIIAFIINQFNAIYSHLLSPLLSIDVLTLAWARFSFKSCHPISTSMQNKTVFTLQSSSRLETEGKFLSYHKKNCKCEIFQNTFGITFFIPKINNKPSDIKLKHFTLILWTCFIYIY